MITANPDVQKQPYMEKMSSEKKVEDVSKLVISCFLRRKTTSLLSPHPHALQHRQVGLDDDRILACQV